MVEKHARQLGLTKNDLGPVGASRSVDLLTRSDLSSVGYKSAQVITAIYLSSNDIKDEGFKVDFINQVFRFFSKYSYILFNCNIMNIIDDMLSWFSLIYSTSPRTTGALVIAKLISSGRLPLLVKVGLNDNQITDEGAVAIAHALCVDRSLFGIRISSSSSRIRMVDIFATDADLGGNPAPSPLEVLGLSDNLITTIGATALARSLSFNTTMKVRVFTP